MHKMNEYAERLSRKYIFHLQIIQLEQPYVVMKLIIGYVLECLERLLVLLYSLNNIVGGIFYKLLSYFATVIIFLLLYFYECFTVSVR